MKTALFISPHLDDAAFSCGGTFARLADDGWRVVLCTIFTKSVINPTGFALACQLDKNLPADADYMKIRRAEDVAAGRILGAAAVLHLDFSEAPHRGYESAAELFAGVKAGDDVSQSVAERLGALNETYEPELIFAPQGLGNHADHLQTIRAAQQVFPTEKTLWFRDTPYAIRQPDAPPARQSPRAVESFCAIEPHLERKISACLAYESQIDFQFGGAERLKLQLETFHRSEAKRLGVSSTAVEIFLGVTPFDLASN